MVEGEADDSGGMEAETAAAAAAAKVEVVVEVVVRQRGEEGRAKARIGRARG